MTLTPKQREREELGILEVAKRRLFFQDNPLQIVTPDETLDRLLLGMKFQVTDLNYVTNTVTFKLVE